MKKVLFIAAIAVAALASCVKNEVLPNTTDQNAIKFDVYTGRAPQTKGVVESTSTIQQNGFGIMAAYTNENAYSNNASNFMYNQKVTYTSSDQSWNYSPIKYWPTNNGDKISFFAYAPYAENATSTPNPSACISLGDNTTASNTLEFTVQQDANKTVDFVAASLVDQVAKKHGEENKMVFTLKHELTRLAFDAKVSADVWTEADDEHATQIVVKNVRFVAKDKLYEKGTYTFGTTGNIGTWSCTKFSADYDVTEILASTDISIGAKESKYNNGGKKALALSTDEAVDMFNGGASISATAEANRSEATKYLFMLPAATPDGTVTAGDIQVVFDYDIVTVDDALNLGYSCTSATKVVNLPENVMRQGKAYRLTFTFGVDEIVVSASVEAWGAEASMTGDVNYENSEHTPAA